MILHPPLFLIKFEFSKVGVHGDGKTGVPGEKGLRAKKRTYHKLDPHEVLALALESIRPFLSICANNSPGLSGSLSDMTPISWSPIRVSKSPV